MFYNQANFGKGYFQVSEISGLLKRLIEENFFDLRIKGEVSGLKSSASGHCYFNLKDENALINAVCWRNIFSNTSIKIEDGMEIICSGKLSTYPSRSTYQFVVNKVEIAGQGALLAAFEKKKKIFMQEGLFDEKIKKKIPFLPKSLGLITSLNGAVIQDMLHRIEDRFPLEVMIWNVAVQGVDAADQIASAIIGFNNMPSKISAPEVLIIARGGGSTEDLWSFNEEVVVRAIAASDIPVITAIGHETDFTLADFAADLRAPTPTAAIEFALPVLKVLRSILISGFGKINKLVSSSLEKAKSRIYRSSACLVKGDGLFEVKRQKIVGLRDRVQYTLKIRLEKIAHLLDVMRHKLDKHDHDKILSKGFALIYEPSKNHVVTSAKSLANLQDIVLKMHDGSVCAKIKK